MENLNLRPDQLKGILSLFASGKFQSLLEASGSSLATAMRSKITLVLHKMGTVTAVKLLKP